MKLLSLIIPVYNCDNTLEKCITSVVDSIGQEFKDKVEIICVNDGSTDQSRFILEEFAEKLGDLIIVIHKSNGGPSSARNVALDIMSGKYVGFVDSDDFVQIDYIKEVFHKINSIKTVDIIELQSYSMNLELEKKMMQSQVIHDEFSSLNNFIYVCQYYLFMRVIRTDMIKNLKFNEKIRLCEDALFLTECYFRAEEIVYISKPLYNYVFNDSSITNNMSQDQVLDLEQIIKICADKLNSNSNNTRYKALYIGLMGNMLNIRRFMKVVMNKQIKLDNFETVYFDMHRDLLKKLYRESGFKIKYKFKTKIAIMFPELVNFYTYFRNNNIVDE